MCRRIRTEAESLGDEFGPIAVYPLYSSLPPRQQQDIFKEAPPPRQPGGPPGTSTDVCIVQESSFVQIENRGLMKKEKRER